jgi:hypothetical protein
VEHLLFLPTEDPVESIPPQPLTFGLELFQSRITHVLLNWTVMPLTPAFRRYTEDLIRSWAGAHLESRFLWFERAEFAPASHEEAHPVSYHRLAALHGEWIRAGRPALRWGGAPEGSSLIVHGEDLAAQLFALLTERRPGDWIGAEV